jgi:hypothetical protein
MMQIRNNLSDSISRSNANQIVYVALSKLHFYLRAHISKFVLDAGATPVSPFMNFDYNLLDLVDRDQIRAANNTLVTVCDELWVFGPVSDGVLVEVYLARQQAKLVRYFQITAAQRFVEITPDHVQLEDVSSWMWERLQTGQKLERWHPRLRFHKAYPLVYSAYSKHNFFWQNHISLYCLKQRVVPLNPFMLFHYFLSDSVSRERVYEANRAIVLLAEQVWVFGEVADGVLAEIKLKQEQGGHVKYFDIIDGNPVRFRRVKPSAVRFEEPQLESFRSVL